MPFKSKAQARWAFSPAGKKALGGGSAVKEWASVTDFSKLPEKKSKLKARHVGGGKLK